jgi:hypothetical protein
VKKTKSPPLGGLFKEFNKTLKANKAGDAARRHAKPKTYTCSVQRLGPIQGKPIHPLTYANCTFGHYTVS